MTEETYTAEQMIKGQTVPSRFGKLIVIDVEENRATLQRFRGKHRATSQILFCDRQEDGTWSAPRHGR